jgi:hypothetical protein
MTAALSVKNIILTIIGGILLWTVIEQLLPNTLPMGLIIGLVIAGSIIVGSEFLIQRHALVQWTAGITRIASIAFGLFVIGLTISMNWNMGMPGFGWAYQAIIYIWQLALWIITVCTIYAVGEITIRKYIPVGNGRAVTRVLLAIASLVLATAIIISFMTGGFWSFGWVGNVYNAGISGTMLSLYNNAKNNWAMLNTILILTITTIIVLYGAVLNMTGGQNFAKKSAWVAGVIGVLLVIGYWLVGQQRMETVNSVIQNGARNQFDAWFAWFQGRAPHPPILAFDSGMIALGFLGFWLIWGLWKKEFLRTSVAVIAAIVLLPVIIWSAWGALPADFKTDVGGVVKAVGKLEMPAILAPSEVVVDLNRTQQQEVSLAYNQTLRIYKHQPATNSGECFKARIVPSAVWRQSHNFYMDDGQMLQLSDTTLVAVVTIRETFRNLMRAGDYKMDLVVTRERCGT